MTARRMACDEHDNTERLSPDDMATLREAQFRAAALAAHAQAACQAQRTPGLCANCRQPCLPQAAYCDADCRADDEARLQVRRRQGLRR